MSADGYVAGPNQTRAAPLGSASAERLHAWMFDTPDENRSEVDRIVDAGAFVMGRNMFGPIRGEWGDEDWRGWWGTSRRTTVPSSSSPITRARC
jgi:dihydrofolate reductase